MDKNAIKKYATWARRELISRVSQKAAFYGITYKSRGVVGADNVDGRVLTASEKKQRDALIRQIGKEGYEQVMEEVAYTWFNRFCALRYMEVNNYLPSHVRVFTDESGAFKPQILTEAINLELDGLNMEKVYALKDANRTEELYRYLLITQCNALSSILPGMFQKIEDYTELLLPDNLLREGSAIEQMISLISEEDWTDQVQIIGWLYQYYIAEKKDDVFAALKKNVKITKENIPAATQLFTPDWIVRYMVENSLGRLWVEGHPNEELKASWKYYLEEAEQEPEVQVQLSEIRKEYAALNPQDIRVIDPCMGSGHILVYMFDVLMQIYEAYGYSARDAVKYIVENNLYGLDIDDRAAQLSYFAVMMKARSYDRRFFTRGCKPKVYAIQESNGIDAMTVDYFVDGDPDRKKAMDTILTELNDAKEYGSILTVTPQDWSALYDRFDAIFDDISFLKTYCWETLLPLVQVAEALSQKYHTCVTNPPYMGASGMSAKLGEYVKKTYPDSKSDLFAVFIERCGRMIVPNGYQAMITQHAWMFLSSFEKLRTKLLAKDTINMAHLGARAFEEIGGEVVQTTSFVLCNRHLSDYVGTYCRLIEPTTQQGKEDMFLAGENRHIAHQSNFFKIPGSPVAYWASKAMLSIFSKAEQMGVFAEGRKGLVTGNDDVYLKLWHEVSAGCFSVFAGFETTKWKPCNKGGYYRKWYGNNDYIVNWGSDGTELANHRWPDGRQRSSLRNSSYFFREGITWTYITSGTKCFRYYPKGFAFAGTGPGLFAKASSNIWYILAYTNSVVFDRLLKLIGSSTISLESGEVERAPIYIIQDRVYAVSTLSKSNVSSAKTDWDSFETSWDFKKHPLI